MFFKIVRGSGPLGQLLFLFFNEGPGFEVSQSLAKIKILLFKLVRINELKKKVISQKKLCTLISFSPINWCQPGIISKPPDILFLLSFSLITNKRVCKSDKFEILLKTEC